MNEKEINIAILEELKRIANDIFTNEIDIEPGTYTAAELSKEKSAKGDDIIINYINTNNENLLMRSVNLGSFKCKFDRKNIFYLVWKFEQLISVKQQDKVRFVKIEAEKADLHFSFEITKEMQSLCKCVGNNPQYPTLTCLFIDYKKGYIVATNGKHLQACKANIFNIVGETETSVLVNPKDFKHLSGVCSVTVSSGKVTVTDKDGRIYYVETFRLKYPHWASVVPKVSQNNYIKIKEAKEVLSFLKKKEGTFYMYAEKGHKVTVDYKDSESGASSEIEVFTENKIPFAFSVMLDSKSFQTVAQKWNGGIFIDANYKPIVLTDKNENICFLIPSGVGKEGFFKMDFDFDRSNMFSLLDYQKEEKSQTSKSEFINLSVISLDHKDYENEDQLIDIKPEEVEELKDLPTGADALPDEKQPFADNPNIVSPSLSRMDVLCIPPTCALFLNIVSFALLSVAQVWDIMSANGNILNLGTFIGLYELKSAQIRGSPM